MADLLVGGALLSGFINVLFDRLASKEVLNFIRGKKVIPKLLKELEITLMSANVLLNDAEDKQLGDNNVKKWLEDLKEVLYKADHMVDKINTKALQLRMEKDERKRAKNKGEIFPCLEEFELERCQKLNMALPVCNFPSLKCIDITSCNELVTVFPASAHVDSTYPRLKKLFIRGCPMVESFSEMGLLPITLKTLSIESCDMLIENRMRWNLQRNLSLKQFEIIECGGVVDSFPEEWLLPPTLRILSIKFCSNLKVLNGKGFQHLTSLQELNLHYLEKLECLPNEGLPQTLTSLDIDGCDLLISQKIS
ncbi:putative disease resistance protein At3g14460 isoform X2 [Humulus lupulus]|uniref:putative disease resistance protein At3g14460 isoform X2 n=1 Tax=Humulus lupulus TaxID=3486 RepID=UPI002B40529E|nr:putative disease resistance protein At3g14460 isoform X2 [Humulus lupulus]